MKVLKYFLSAVFVILVSPSIFAYTLKEGNVTAIVGPYLYKTNFGKTTTDAQSPILGGLGLIIQGDVSDHSGLEIALFHMNKIYLREQGTSYVTEETQLIHVTLGYRYWINPYFSLSGAFYSAYALADPKIIHSDFPIGSEIDTSARDTTEYGFDFSVQSELWSKDDMAVIADARYALSVTNKANEKGDHYGLFLGVKFQVQEKQHEHVEKK